MSYFVNTMCEAMVKDGRRFRVGEVITDLSANEQPMMAVAVLDTSRLAASSRLFGPMSALQLVYADREGRFPWDEGHAFPLEEQPLLGRA